MYGRLIITGLLILGTVFLGGCEYKGAKSLLKNTPKPSVQTQEQILLSADSYQKGNSIKVTVYLESLSRHESSGNYVVSLDFYPVIDPGHPERHYGFWNWTYDQQNTQLTEFTINSQTKETKLIVNSNPLQEGKEFTSWRGKTTEGDIVAYLAVWNIERPQFRRVHELFRFNSKGSSINSFGGKPLRKIMDFGQES